LAFPWAVEASVAADATGIYRIIRVKSQDRFRRKNRTIIQGAAHGTEI
jgi:hypothetical protein